MPENHYHKEPTYNLTASLVSYIAAYKESHSAVEIAVHLKLIESEINYWLESLLEIAPGPERARYAHSIIEAQRAQYYAAKPAERIKLKCRRQCHFCCSAKVQITSDEAALLKTKPIVGHTTCPYLTTTGDCSVYDDRPAVCRNIEVQSDPIHCKESHSIAAVIILKAEIVATAALTACENAGPLDEMLPKEG